jgi:hypothetical protein
LGISHIVSLSRSFTKFTKLHVLFVPLRNSLPSVPSLILSVN